MAPSHKCIDCAGALSDIRPIDRKHASHELLSFAAAKSSRCFVSGRYKIAGRVNGLICGSCARILLRGEPEK